MSYGDFDYLESIVWKIMIGYLSVKDGLSYTDMYIPISGHYIIILTHCQCCLMRIGNLQPAVRLAMIS